MRLPTTSPDTQITTFATIHEMGDFVDAESMRTVRNQVRGFMTHNTGHITRQQQMAWLIGTYNPARAAGELHGFIVQDNNDDPIGYGMIQHKGGCYWVGGGLIEQARGAGLGKQLFTYLTDYVHGELAQQTAWLDVREDNPAQNVYRRIGYEVVGHEAQLIVMRHEVKV